MTTVLQVIIFISLSLGSMFYGIYIGSRKSAEIVFKAIDESSLSEEDKMEIRIRINKYMNKV